MLWSALKDAHLESLRLHGGERNWDKSREVTGRFTKKCDPMTVEQIDRRMVLSYLTWRKSNPGRNGKPLSVFTLNGDIRYLNWCFKDVRENWLPKEMPWEPPITQLLPEPKIKPKGVSQDVLGKAFDACSLATRPAFPDCTAAHWWRTLFLLSYVTGVRCGALLALPRPTEDDLSRRLLVVPAEFDKAGEERSFPLTAEALWAIKGMPAGGDRLFAWPFGRRYFYTILHRFQDKAGMPRGDHALPHALRKTKATELVRGGASMLIVQREMGHSTMNMAAKHYVGEISDAQRTAVEALPMPVNVRQRVHSGEEQLCLAFD